MTVPYTRPLALDFTLSGSRLIEASAGTGKTFTISALYLRLVLGHGEEAAFRRQLLPPEILVVTFTDAATRELRDRIRLRLVEAAQVFRDEITGDDLLQQLKADFSPEQWLACAQRLDIAAQWMDEAAVSTIHSWCQRMLQEHAFDSGSLFTQTLQKDHSELKALVVRDYWRLQCYLLQGEALEWVIKHWQTPTLLLENISPLLKDNQPTAAPCESLAELLAQELAARKQVFAELKAPWLDWVAEIQPLLQAAIDAKPKPVNGRLLQTGHLATWMKKLADWASNEDTVLDIGAGFKRLTPDGLLDAWKIGSPPEHPAFEAMVSLKDQVAALTTPLVAARQHAAAWIAQRFDAEKRRRAEMGFNDMLTRFDEALQGDNGPRLAEVIRAQFPVALIDEFQDTDPLQYRIFDTIYSVADNHQDRGLFLIGDPKQAIYGFRGADIHTYLTARYATEGRHASLDTNFRSATPMVQAVNRLFELAECRESGAGAFLFRQAQDNPLPFMPVNARGRAERWVANLDDNRPAPALTLWQAEQTEPWSGEEYLSAMAASAATEITQLLNRGQLGTAGFKTEDTLVPVSARDIAILVRTGKEATAIRNALALRGVRSVYLSDKDSVFSSQEAKDILLWLQACAEPEQDRLLRAALATRSLGLTLFELEQLNQDELHWERRVMEFRDYRTRWRRQGLLPMLHQLLHNFALPSRLLQATDGDRRVTNLLHLAELLQQAAANLDGEQALIRHLAERIRSDQEQLDEQVLRLESDADLVRVVTIHKSKGLEYPLVFLPFICSYRPIDKNKGVAIYNGEQRQLILNPNEQQVVQAEQEQLAENLRLLYVALTRSRHGCWLGMADIKYGNNKDSLLHKTAIGHLLGNGQALPSSEALSGWLTPLQVAGETACVPAPEANEAPLLQGHIHHQQLSWATPQRRAAEHWWIASYSALRTGELSTPALMPRFNDAAPDSAAAATIGDDEREAVFVPLRASDTPTLHNFPRGPNPGTFLHGLLELAAEENFAPPSLTLSDTIARRCQLRDWSEWSTPLIQWLDTLVTTPLLLTDSSPADTAEQALTLANLTTYQSELEFWFEASQVDVRQLDQLVQGSVLAEYARPSLLPDTLNGMFKGFIDLVFEHQGRYYVVDYKSNWLGASDTDYTQAAMIEQIVKHRYDLQYVLYLLALHRQLKLRLPDYDYDTHMGGALYLFMRHPEAIYYDRPPKVLIEALDALFSGETEVTQ